MILFFFYCRGISDKFLLDAAQSGFRHAALGKIFEACWRDFSIVNISNSSPSIVRSSEARVNRVGTLLSTLMSS